MTNDNEVKSAYDNLTPEQREAVLFSAQLAKAAQAFNEIAHEAYRKGRLAPSNTETAH